MKYLTEKKVNTMTKKEVQTKINEMEDKMCNTDYRTNAGALEHQIYERNAQILINKQNGEF